MQALLQSKGVQHAIEMVGGGGYYQKRTMWILVLHHVFRSFFTMYYPFMTQTPVFSCEDPENPGSFYDCSENNGGCAAQTLSANSPQSLVVELGLYCDRAYYRTMAGTFFFVGGNLGAFVVAYLADKKGRKPAMSISYMAASIALLLLGTMTSGPWTYTFFLMLTYFAQFYYCTLALTYMTEISDEKFAKSSTFLILLSIAASELVLIFIAYFIQNWRVVMIFFIALPNLITCLSFKYIYESPAYFFGKKDYKQAEAVLHQMANTNNKPLPVSQTVDTQDQNSLPSTKEDEAAVKSYNYFEILCHPKLRTRVLTFSVIKAYLYVSFMGSLLALSSLGGNIYVNAAIAAIAEGLGYVIYYPIKHVNERTLLKRFLQIIVAVGICFLVVPDASPNESFLSFSFLIRALLAFIMRASICVIYSFIYALGAELFPPEVRSQSVGISDVTATLSGMFTPSIILFAEIFRFNCLSLFGMLGFAALLASQYLPRDTLKTLDDDVNEDIELSYMKMKADD